MEGFGGVALESGVTPDGGVLREALAIFAEVLGGVFPGVAGTPPQGDDNGDFDSIDVSGEDVGEPLIILISCGVDGH